MNTVKNIKKEKEIILACSLGDGYIYCNEEKHSAALKITHSENQVDYLKWKTSLIQDLTGFTTGESVYINKNKYGFKAYTKAFYGYKKLRIYRKWLYNNKTKTVKKILQYLSSPLSLAIWFMDDGSIMKRKKKHKDGSIYYLKPSMELCTHSFPNKDQQVILNWLKTTYNIDGYTVKKFSKKQNKHYYMLNFNVQNTKKIYNLIYEYIIKIDSMTKKFKYLLECYSAEHV